MTQAGRPVLSEDEATEKERYGNDDTGCELLLFALLSTIIVHALNNLFHYYWGLL